MAIFGNQLKAARALAGLDQRTLAERAEIGVNTIRNMEAAAAGDVPGLVRTLDKIVGR
jgi:transcriptional regulator with XRE-family HTH domain